MTSIIHFILQQTKSLEGIQLIIKMHPKDDNKEFYKNLIKEENSDAIVTMEDKADLYEQLYISDLILTEGSTVALDALIFAKKIIIIDFNKRINPRSYYYNASDIVISEKADFIENFKKILTESNQKVKNHRKKELQKKFFYKIDFEASKRISEILSYSL